MKKKLKKKIWIIATVILTIYSALLIANPTIWTALLPIIIPSGILTIGIPTYAIVKNSKDMLEKTSEKQITTSINIKKETEVSKKEKTND